MTWRIHLTNQAIQRLHFLPGKIPVLAVWANRRRVSFYNAETGAYLHDHRIPIAPPVERHSEEWQAYVGGLLGPNERTYLPLIHTPQAQIYVTHDGKLRLYHIDGINLFLEMDGKESSLPVQDAEDFLGLDLDRALGVIAALDETGRLHIYQQNIRVGMFDIGLQLQPDVRPTVRISNGGGTICVTDGRRLVVTNYAGDVTARYEAYYFINRLACSPSGNMVVTSDIESGVVRVYRGSDLTLTHQRFALDLIAGATQVQLMADLPPVSVATNALAAHNRGQIAFALSGVICMTNTEQMDELPRPQALL